MIDETVAVESPPFFAAQNFDAAGSAASGLRSFCMSDWQGLVVVAGTGVPDETAMRPRNTIE